MPPAGDTGTIDNGPGVVPVDDTVGNGDGMGDACDPDLDNDGLANTDEEPLASCGAFNGVLSGHPSPIGGDVTNDDDGDGDPAPAMGTDAGDDGPSWDTDNDGSRDGYECVRGTNPRSAASKPGPLADDNMDTDGDGLKNGWERRGWGTDHTMVNTDGDALNDCHEVADVDGNGLVNSTGDFIAYANAFFKFTGKTWDFDMDKNGLLNTTGDFVAMAGFVFTGPCL
jgi:hypothetical protein